MAPDGLRVVRLADGAVERIAAGRWGGFNWDGVAVRGDEDGGRVIRVRGAMVAAELELGPISAFAATADGRWFATGRHDGTITVRAADFSVRCTLQAVDRATTLAISPDGRRLVAGGWDATVHAFELPGVE
jgi:WD40 repeat protein